MYIYVYVKVTQSTLRESQCYTDWGIDLSIGQDISHDLVTQSVVCTGFESGGGGGVR